MRKKSGIKETMLPEKAGKPITELAENLRKGRYDLPPILKPQNMADIEDLFEGMREGEKREAYALTAYFLEKIHPLVKEPLEGGTIRIYGKRMTRPEPHHVISLTPEDLAPGADGLFEHLVMLEYESRFKDAQHEWAIETRKMSPDTTERKAYERLRTIALRRSDGETALPEEFIFRGAKTAGEVCWRIQRAIPVAFTRKYGRTITPAEFKDLSQSAASLVAVLSAMHLDSLNVLGKFWKKGSAANKNIGLELPLEFMEIREDAKGKPFCAFDEEALARFNALNEANALGRTGEDRYMCPARAAKVVPPEGGKPRDLVSVIYARHVALAEAYLVPNLEFYTNEVMRRQSGSGETAP